MTKRKPTTRQARTIRLKALAEKNNREGSRLDAVGAVCTRQPKLHLIRTPGPAIDESPAGYALRLANENGFRGLEKLKMVAGFDSGYVITLGWNFARLNDILGKNRIPANFGYCRGQTAKGKVWVLENAVTSEHLGFERARICPQCLAELGYVPIAWDLRACVACVRHRCMMLKHCVDCGVRIRVRRRQLFYCDCGSDLRQARTPPATDELLGMMEVLRAKLADDEKRLPLAQALGFPIDDLTKLSLDLFCKCIVQLTKVILHLDLGYWSHRSSMKVADNLTTTSKVFVNWPVNFKSLCSNWQAHCESRPSSEEGRTNIFQRAYAWLFVKLHKNLRKERDQTIFMVQAALEYGMEAWFRQPIGLRGSAFSKLELPHPRYISVERAAGTLNIRPNSLREMVRKDLFRFRRVSRGGGKCRLVVDIRHLENLRLSKKIGYSRNRAVRFLGISTETYLMLRREGDIPDTYLSLGCGLAAVEDLVEFRNAILNRAIEAPLHVRLCSVSMFLKGAALTQEKVTILREMKTGIIPVFYRRRRATFKDIWTTQDLEKITSTSRRRRYGEGRIADSSLRCLFGLNKFESSAILLHLSPGERAKTCMSAPRSEVEAFLSETPPLRFIARERGVSSLKLIAFIARNNLQRCVVELPHRHKEIMRGVNIFVRRSLFESLEKRAKSPLCG